MSDNSDWIEWKGGECPVDPETHIEVRYRKPREDLTPSKGRAGRYDWNHSTSDKSWAGDIIAYRVVKP